MTLDIPAKQLTAICNHCRVAAGRIGASLGGGAISFKAHGDVAKWSSFDNEAWASASVPHEGEDGEFHTHLATLATWIKNIPAESKLRIQVKERELVVSANSPRTSHRFPLLHPSDVPQRDENHEKWENYTVEADFLKLATRMASQISAAKTGSEVLQSVHYRMEDDVIKVQATNGHMAVSSKLKLERLEARGVTECLVQGKVASQIIAEAQPDEHGDVLLSFSGSGFEVSSHVFNDSYETGAALTAGCGLMTGDPVKMEKFFDTSSSPRAWFMGKETFQSAIRRCLTDADIQGDNGKLKLTPITVEEDDGPVLAMEYKKGDTPIAREQLVGSLIEKEGVSDDTKAGAIYVSGLYLDKALSLFEGRTIYFNDGGFETRQKPIILSDSPVQDARHRMLIMPMAP